MKLILTSNGITNNSIERLLLEQVNDPNILFIPTAANTILGDKSWVNEYYNSFKKLGKTQTLDISKGHKNEWLPRFEESNIIVMSGGNARYLMQCIISCGIMLDLPRLLEDRLYVGISASSMIVSKKVYSSKDFLFGDKKTNNVTHDGLGYVDFNIRPHFNSTALLQDNSLTKAMERVNSDMYALDDNSALFYNKGKVSVISQGDWKLYRK